MANKLWLLLAVWLLGANSQADDCFDLYRLSTADRAVEPGIVIAATATVPEHCAVRGVLNRTIRFEVRMPVTGWNGRFLMEGTGGNSGYIADTTAELARGFAISSTDTGHEGTSMEFVMQPEAALDYAFRAVHLVALLSKEVVSTYYGRKIDYSYYQGCSNGGRQGLIEATRYPEDFDGIVAGAPVFKIIDEFLLWVLTQHRAQTANPLNEAHLQLLDAASRAACDTLDRVEDGVINDPRRCTSDLYDPGALLCKPGENPQSCLSAGQLTTVRQHYAGVVDAAGQELSPGLMPGAEAAGDWRMWSLPGATVPATGESVATSINGLASEMLKYWIYRDADYDLDDFDIETDRGDLQRASAVLDVHTADLSAFRQRGGKVLMYQGWNDYPLRPQRAIEFLNQVYEANGGERASDQFFRLFMIPGMVHCAGGPGAHSVDYLDPLVQWVEQGKAPDRLIGTQPEQAFTRPHCVYPALAEYQGGDSTQAASFRCVAP